MARIAAALGVDSRTLEREVLSVSRERLSAEESGVVVSAGMETSESLIKMIERRVRTVDHELAELLEFKRLLLVLRQYLDGSR